MIIGVPREIKNNENRVALTPAGAAELIKRGHVVCVQANAGIGSGFTNEDYLETGAEYNIRELVQTHDVIIGAVLIPGAKAPRLVTRDMLSTMRPGTVMVDVAVDQGGCFETTKPTTHDHPNFVIDDVIHYCVANMLGAVPRTSTLALTNATLPYAVQLANKGWKQACLDSLPLRKGLNVVQGKVVYEGVAEAFDLPYVAVETIL